MTNRSIYITILALLTLQIEANAEKAAQTNAAPKLVVSISIDQLRSDYLQAFLPLYEDNGFKKLMEDGLAFTNAAYPFTPIDRASSIACIGTGVTPYYNNIIGQDWLSRKTLRTVGCVDDNKYPGLSTSLTASPANLKTSTIGDELKMATMGKAIVYAVAPYRDAAILSAGHAADGALWIDDATGHWCSTSYYYPTLPGWVQAYNRLKAPASKIESVQWEPYSLLSANYRYFVQTNDSKPFKHSFKGHDKYLAYKSSALVNTDMTDMSIQCAASTGIGNDNITDLLSITYYAGCYNHRPLAECQMELQDTYVRLDHEISRLTDYFEKTLGKDKVLFVLTGTGYCEDEEADYTKYRIPTGTFYMNRTGNLMNIYLGAIWGQGLYVEATYRNHFFLNHELLESKKVTISEATERAQEFLAMMSGVSNVYTSLQLLTSQNERLQKVRNGFTPEHCGDLLIEVAPGWHILNEETQKTELSRASLIQFPIIFYGAGTHAEKVSSPVYVDQIAPTIARSIRIRAPNGCSSEPLF